MSINIGLPKITSSTAEGQLGQIKNYLFSLAEQLNVALKTINAESGSTASHAVAKSTSASSDNVSNPVATFNDIKHLIIKSADIVNAYYDVVSERLNGTFEAYSKEFGEYKEATSQEISKTSTDITQILSDLQTIASDLEGVEDSLIEVNAHIRSGLLYYDDNGAPVYGVEVGQKNTVDGEEVFNKYARFIANKLSFYDKNDVEVAYISDYKLYITHAEITGSLTLVCVAHNGNFKFDMSNGLAIKWIGG